MNRALTNLEFGSMPNNRALSGLEFGGIRNNRSVANLEFNTGNQMSMERQPRIVSQQLVRLRDGSVGKFIVLENGKRLIVPLKQ